MNKFINPDPGQTTNRRTREDTEQLVAQAGDVLTLYHSPFCGYCFRVQAVIQQLSLKIKQKNIITEKEALADLLKGGGKRTVPCLRIDRDGKSFWMYESADIIAYLMKNYR